MKNSFIFLLNKESIQWLKQTINDTELKALGSFTKEDEFYLKVQGQDERISDNNPVDLTRFGIEEIYSKKAEKFRFTINDVLFISSTPFVNEGELRKKGNLVSGEKLYLKVEGPNKLITAGENIDLAPFGIEEFYSETEDKKIILIISGVLKSWDKDKITFEEVIKEAYSQYIDSPAMIYTVAYEDGPMENREGSMIKGSIVFTKNKMIFHATATNQS